MAETLKELKYKRALQLSDERRSIKQKRSDMVFELQVFKSKQETMRETETHKGTIQSNILRETVEWNKKKNEDDIEKERILLSIKEKVVDLEKVSFALKISPPEPQQKPELITPEEPALKPITVREVAQKYNLLANIGRYGDTILSQAGRAIQRDPLLIVPLDTKVKEDGFEVNQFHPKHETAIANAIKEFVGAHLYKHPLVNQNKINSYFSRGSGDSGVIPAAIPEESPVAQTGNMNVFILWAILIDEV